MQWLPVRAYNVPAPWVLARGAAPRFPLFCDRYMYNTERFLRNAHDFTFSIHYLNKRNRNSEFQHGERELDFVSS